MRVQFAGGIATLDDIRVRAGASKSQLFHYFPGGKDALLLEVARYEAGRVLEDQQPHLGCLDSWDAWYRWRDAVLERYEMQGDFCPLAALSQHIGRSTPGARAIVAELMREWQERLATGIRAMQASGNLPLSLDVDQAAAALLAGIQGGVSIMLTTGQSTHLRAALDWGSCGCGPQAASSARRIGRSAHTRRAKWAGRPLPSPSRLGPR